MKCFPYHFDFIETFFFKFVSQKTIFFFFCGIWGRNNNGFSFKQPVCVEYPGRGFCIPWKRISRAKFPVVCPKETRLRLQALYIPTKNPVRLPPASKVNRCSAIDRRPVVEKHRNLVNYLTSISLFNARKFVVCIFEISDEDLAPTE